MTNLFEKLNSTSSVGVRQELISAQLKMLSNEDALWLIAILTGRQPKKFFKKSTLWDWACEFSEYPVWLMEESNEATGNISDTIQLIIPNPDNPQDLSLNEMMKKILWLRDKDPSTQKTEVFSVWKTISPHRRQEYLSILMGQNLAKVNPMTLSKALSRICNLDPKEIMYLLSREWTPEKTSFEDLLPSSLKQNILALPYPFKKGNILKSEPEQLGKIHEWRAEWKWLGIRVQLVKRKDDIQIWSEDNLLTASFPEYKHQLEEVPMDFILDGQLVAHSEEGWHKSSILDTRLRRKNPTRSFIAKHPVSIIAFDLLALNANDLRGLPLINRLVHLEELVIGLSDLRPGLINLSNPLQPDSWDDLFKNLEEAKSMNTSGIILKNKMSTYDSIEDRSDWVMLDQSPYEIWTTLLYASRGSGIETDSFVQLSLAVDDGHTNYIPIARVVNVLDEGDNLQLKQYIGDHSIERFGPVKSVHPGLMFRLKFDRVESSKRHKCGLKLVNAEIVEMSIERPLNDVAKLFDISSLL